MAITIGYCDFEVIKIKLKYDIDVFLIPLLSLIFFFIEIYVTRRVKNDGVIRICGSNTYF